MYQLSGLTLGGASSLSPHPPPPPPLLALVVGVTCLAFGAASVYHERNRDY
ncbi:MAG TPA: hypothetical protein VJ761_02755 [Ktedonobacteraceae bacterium]|nr:hypothetical protein [Ktedonobacteraceae bacterium]